MWGKGEMKRNRLTRGSTYANACRSATADKHGDAEKNRHVRKYSVIARSDETSAGDVAISKPGSLHSTTVRDDKMKFFEI